MTNDVQSMETAWRFWRLGNVFRAEREVSAILGERPDYAEALILLALCQNARGEKAEARTIIDRALSIDGENPLAWRISGVLYDQENEGFHDAETAYNRAIELGPWDAYNHAAIADFYHRRAQYPKAEAAYETALGLDPENDEVLTQYAELVLDRGDVDKAQALAIEAARISPDSASLVLLLGEIAFRDGEFGEARDRALWVLSHDAENQQALTLLTKTKARKNPFLGLWMKWAMFSAKFSGKVQIGIILGLWLFFNVSWRVMSALGVPGGVINVYIWVYIAFCLMTWVAPYIFARMVKAESKTVSLRQDF